jgi:hypothetical protein
MNESPYIFSISSIGVLLAAVAAKRAMSALLNARYLNQKCAVRRQQYLRSKEAFAAQFQGKKLTDRQREILGLDMEALRLRLQEGDLTAAEVMEAFQAKAVETDEKTNAVTEFLEEAMAKARELDALPRESRGPLHGIPISLKVWITS